MKRLMKFGVLFALGVLLSTGTALAAENTYTPYDGASYTLTYYENQDGTLTITGYTATAEGELILPESIEGKMVTEIGRYAFSGCSGFTGNLFIPDSVTTIGDGTFYGCSGFTGSLTIGNGVTSISSSAFSGCSGFTGSLVIPDGVTEIGWYAFKGCNGFTGNLFIPDSVTTIGDKAFYGCSGFTGSLVIPDSVTEIGNYAFRGCNGFTGNLFIPDSVTTIGDEAFYGCSGFTGSLTIGNGVTSISSSAFSGCSGFTGSLVIPDSVTEIGDHAFDGCTGFSGKLYLPKTLEEIGDEAFSDCSGFTGSLVIPDSVTVLGPLAFDGCSGFNGNLVIGNGIKEIGRRAFFNCSGFAGSLKIGDAVTTIGGGAFYNCTGFTGALIIPNSVQNIESSTDYGFGTIDYGAFENCTGFTGNLIIPDNVTTIGAKAFYNCSGFDGTLKIGSSVEAIGASAFGDCTGLKGNLIIPDNVKTISSYLNYLYQDKYHRSDASNLFGAFRNCTGLTGNLAIGVGLENIGPGAFENCSGLTGNLVIPDSVTEIGNSVFSGCSGFTGSLVIPDGVTEIGWYAFKGCNGFTGNLFIPDSVTTIGDEAFYGCSGFTGSLTIGNGVTEIREDAFSGCSGFTGNLVIPDSVTQIGFDAFYGCNGLTGSLTIGNGITRINQNMFRGCNSFAGDLTIGNSVTEIENSAFSGYSSFTGNLVISDSVTKIGNYAFRGCSGFTGNLVIPDSVSEIGNYAFSGCKGFTGSLVIPNSVTQIGYDAFYGCSGFTGNLVIPNSVTTIESSAFSECSGFTGSLVIPDGVTEIGWSAFSGCSGFTGNLVIPNSVTTIESSAFSDCSGFTGNLVIPNGVTEIRGSAFSGCSGFTGNLVIPNGVTEIGNYAFSGCSGFTGNLVIPDSVSEIGDYAFSGCNGFTGSLTIGNGVTEIGSYAFSDCNNLVSVVIPNSVTVIGYAALRDCAGLKNIYYSGSETQWNAISGTESYNIPSKATIHYKSSPQNSFGSVMFLLGWDSVSRTLSFADTPIQYRLVGNPATIPESLLGKYVEVYTDQENIFDVTDIQPVNSYIGTVSATTVDTLTIDGTTYPVAYDLILSFYMGKGILYHVKDGEIVALSLLEEKSGIIDEWNSTTQELTIDWRSYPTNFLTDISFLANLDQNLNKQATFLVAAGDNYTPIIKITDYTEPALGSIREGFCFTANTPMNSIPLGSTIDFYVGYYVSNRLDSSVKDYITVVGDSGIVSIQAKDWNDNYGQHYKVTAKRVGQTTLTVSHPYYDDATPVDIFVVPTDTVYSFSSVPKMTVEEGKVTNFYNYEGLVVDNFTYYAHKADSGIVDYYNVTMDIYNSRNLYGAVTAYDSSGNIKGFKVIDRKDDLPSNFVGTLKDLYLEIGDLFYLIGNEHYYSGKSISKKTPVVDFQVPAGGYLSISNNADTSEIVMAANLVGITMDVVTAAGKLATSASKLDDTPIIIDAVTKDLINEKLVDTIKDTAKDEFKSASWNYSNVGQAIQGILVRLEGYGINLAERVGSKITSVPGMLSIGESVAMNIIPTGQLIKFLYASMDAGDVTANCINLCKSVAFANGIYLYAPIESSSYQSNGISVTSQGSPVDDIVVHAYMISDIPLMDPASIAAQAKYYWEDSESSTYNITMYKNGTEVQPTSSVEVRIPLPDTFKEKDVSKIRVYRQNDDGSVTDMNAVVLEGYAVFSTDHFSYYTMVNQDKASITVSSISVSGNATTIDAVVYCPSAEKMTVYCAFYSETGQMLDIEAVDIVSGDEVPCTFVSNKSVSSAKIFVVDSNGIPQNAYRAIELNYD